MNFDVVEHFLKNRPRRVIPLNGYKPAASLVPIVFNKKLHLLITRRADHLKNHPGQYSFPGGHIEEGDKAPLDAALRETEEEIGVRSSDIKILGRLDDVVSVTNFHLSPFLGIVPFMEHYPFDKNEVASVHIIPLNIFSEPPRVAYYHWNGEKKKSYLYKYGEVEIFGVTAKVIHNLMNILEDSGFFNAYNDLI